jgi:hypothetical protein
MINKTLALPAPREKKHSFSWGAIIRPIHIHLGHDTTLYWEMCDCTGLTMGDTDIPEVFYPNLRTPAEMREVASWLDHLAAINPIQGKIVLTRPNFSPEFEGESFYDDEADEYKYDATLLEVTAWVTRANHLLFEDDNGEECMAEMGIPWICLPTLADALRELADTWEDGSLMLGEDEPLLADPN